MTPQEFKAWFDGFTEAMTGSPTKAQWTRIKERVSEIDGRAVTERIYLDRYWYGWPNTTILCGSGGTTSNVTFTVSNCTSEFDSQSAMFTLGKNDAALLAA